MESGRSGIDEFGKKQVRFEKKERNGVKREGKKNMKGPLERERGRKRVDGRVREVCRKRSVGKINMLSGATGRDNQSCLTLVSPWCQCVCV